jgi:hypothetical protein
LAHAATHTLTHPLSHAGTHLAGTHLAGTHLARTHLAAHHRTHLTHAIGSGTAAVLPRRAGTLGSLIAGRRRLGGGESRQQKKCSNRE